MAERSPLRLAELALWLAIGVSGTGCVRVYQPMSGLHRPVVVDPQLANFEDVALTVNCVPEGLLNAAEANALCQKVGTLFENQGAVVTTSIGGSRDEALDEAEAPTEEAPPPPPTDLTLELRAREIHEASNLLSWIVCIGTFTVVPAITETTFAQDVVIRDANGSLLVSDSLEGRLVLRFGAGAWIGNQFMDIVTRDKEDRLTGDAINRDLSADLYRQLSQMLFNAKMQWQVLEQRARP